MAYDLTGMARRKRRRKPVAGLPLDLNTRGAERAFRMELRAGMQRIINVWNRVERDVRAQLITRNADELIIQDSEASDLMNLMEQARQETERITLLVLAGLPALIGSVEKRHNRAWKAAVKRALGVDLDVFLDGLAQSPIIKAHMEWATGLIRDFSDDARQRVSTVVLRAVIEQTPRRKAGKEIADALGIVRRRANNIAIDQARKLNAAFTKLRSEEAGIDHYVWRHSGKKHPREHHVAREGNVYRWDKPPSGGHPRTEPNCGCVAQPYIKLMDELEDA